MGIKSILDKAQLLIDFISSVCIALAVSILFYSVVMRYVFHSPPAWAQEVTRYMFVWLIMLAGASVTRDESHLNINVFLDMMPDKMRLAVLVFLRLLMLAFCGVLVHQTIKIYPRVAEAMSPILPISMGWLYLSIAVGGILMAVFLLERLFSNQKPAEECACEVK